MSVLSLPTAYNTPSENFSDYIYHFGGVKKIGKTAFAAQWPDHYILEGEPGNAAHLKCRFTDIHVWLDAINAINLLRQKPGYCKTLCIDGVQAFYDMLVKHVAQDTFKLKSTDRIPIDVWNPIRVQWSEFWRDLRQLGVGLIANSHVEIKEMLDLNNKNTSVILPVLGKQCAEVFNGIAHFTGIMLRNDIGGRELYIVGTSHLECGHGITDHFLHPETKKPLQYIDMGESAKEAFDNFFAAFYNMHVPKEIEGRRTKAITGEDVPQPHITKEIPKITKKGV